MDKKVPLSEKKAKVNGILTKLGLATVKDSLCGFPGGLIRGNDLVMASGVCSPQREPCLTTNAYIPITYLVSFERYIKFSQPAAQQ